MIGRQYMVGRHTIIQEDCLVAFEAIPEGSVDVVVTSPPYNLKIGYGSYKDNLPRDAYLDWISELASKIHTVLKINGSLFLNVGSTGLDPWIVSDVSDRFRALFQLQNHIVWVKSISIESDTVGHFKPINSKRFLNNNHEAILHFTKTGEVPLDRLAVGVPYKDKTNVSRWDHAKADLRCAGNTWFIPYETVRSKSQKFNHPAGFPVALPERCIRLHGVTGAIVLDPLMGTGTTLVAAARLGCIGIGFEIDPDYVRVALERLSAEGAR